MGRGAVGVTAGGGLVLAENAFLIAHSWPRIVVLWQQQHARGNVVASDRTPAPRTGKRTIRGLIYLNIARLHHRLISDGKKPRTNFRDGKIRAAHAHGVTKEQIAAAFALSGQHVDNILKSRTRSKRAE